LLEHVAALLGTQQPSMVQTIRDADALTYMHHTRRVLGAWIYFKRFAVSILKVETSQASEDQTP
jgi:CRISPR-associated protein Cmr5